MTASPLCAVADQVAEVHHLARHRVVGGEVPTREELAEVQAVVGHGPDGRGTTPVRGHDPRRDSGRGRSGRTVGRASGRHPRAGGRGTMRHSSVAGMFRANVADHGDKTMFRLQGTTVTWAEHHARACRVGQRPAGRGRGPRRQGGLPRPQRARVLRGALRRSAGGAVNVAVNWRLAPAEMAAVIDDSRASVLVVHAEFVPVSRRHGERAALGVGAWWCSGTPRPTPIWAGPRTSPVGSATRTGSADQPATDPGHEGDPDDVSMQLYTSGTTGLPKGVMLANRNVEAMLGAGRRATPSRSARTR